MEGSQYWYSTGNPYYPTNGLPNCTCYCYGRWWEITGQNPTNLPRGNGGQWYPRATGFNKGQVPQLGAIACWYDPSGYRLGHVAIVEQILSNGDIVTSNSGYTRDPSEIDNLYFWTEVCYANNGYRSTWEANWGYQLQGFIYLDEAPIGRDWIYGNRYLNETEMQNNASIIYDYLYSKGWKAQAIYAVLGNMTVESTINPAIWENLTVDTSRGYGLVQWTPSTYYTDWATANGFSIDDGTAQLQWIDTVLEPDGYWVQRNGYNITFTDFKTSNQIVDWLTSAFYYNFENPGPSDTSLQNRITWASYWENYFYGYQPSDPSNPDIQGVKQGLKVWQMIKYF